MAHAYLCTDGCGTLLPKRGRCGCRDTRPNRAARSSSAWQHARATARTRDQHQCQECGTANNLEVHHIVPLAQGGSLTDPTNLTTLCAACHHRTPVFSGARFSTPRRLLAKHTEKGPSVG